MTDDEHRARAMLLGGRWGRNSHCYRVPSDDGPTKYYDADTMEELSSVEWNIRAKAGVDRERKRREKLLPPR